MVAAIIQNKLLEIVLHYLGLWGIQPYELSKQGTTSKVENTANEESLKGYAFPPLLLSSLQVVLKVILKIACKATKASKYLNNTMQFIFT